MKAAMVCMAMLVAGCDPMDEPRVGGTVQGLWDGTTGMVLRLTSGSTDALLTVATNGWFEFPVTLQPGAFYALSLEHAPVDHTCVIETGIHGRVGGGEVIAIECTGPAVSVELSGTIPGTFDPNKPRQQIGIPALLATTEITVDVSGDADASLDGTPVALDARTPRSFPIGATMITVGITTRSGLSRRYEIEVDRGGAPLGNPTYGKASDGPAQQGFGTAMAVDGDTLAVAATLAPGDPTGAPGAVYLFARDAGTWAEQAKLVAPVGERASSFGASIALAGDTLVVVGERAAHVYTRGASGWTETQTLLPPSAKSFTGDVAMRGDLLVVGAPYNDSDTLAQVGEAYVFRRRGATWQQDAVLTSGEPAAAQRFGGRLVVDGDTIAVGGMSPSGADAVYVFRAASGGWAREQVLVGSRNGGFGRQMVLSGDELVISAASEPVSGGTDNAPLSGVVHFYARAAGVWTRQSTLAPAAGTSLDRFGAALARAGDVLAVSALFDSGDPLSGAYNASYKSSGAVLLLGRDGATWRQLEYHKAPNPDNNDLFGVSLALSSDSLLVGAPLEDGPGAGFGGRASSDNSAPNTGAIYELSAQ